ncbi:hypothetical protein [Arthrobacter bambusae]|uniref:hypothetical protein n=1 Tax=Arthrobacter bambusae TaxID=1338426 RepID=UPI0027802900|nr:hypothetical protein [Arthrobacter bambusae]MDQ0241392.1 hypothetical protein [Arthrobacter bambusae]
MTSNPDGQGDGFPQLLPGETELSSPEAAEMLWRQVHPKYADSNIITEQAFQPTSSDPKRLSCSRESLQTAQGAYEHHTQKLELQSVGTCAVTVEEAISAGTRPVDDSEVQEQVPPTPGHTYLDYRGLSKDERSFARDELASFATERGFAYLPSGA